MSSAAFKTAMQDLIEKGWDIQELMKKVCVVIIDTDPFKDKNGASVIFGLPVKLKGLIYPICQIPRPWMLAKVLLQAVV